MAEMTIRLQCDPVTGKRDIVISLKSDDETLPHEHEQQHRALVNKLIEGGLLPASEVGVIIVERDREQEPVGPTTTEQPARPAQAEGA